jgi:hypothetical protein
MLMAMEGHPLRTRTVLAALGAVVLALTSVAHADPLACQRGILKESTKLARAQITALRKCEDRKLKGSLPPATHCATEPATALKVAKAESKLRKKLDRACGGPDRACGGGDDESLAAIGWPSTCPDFQSLGCTNVIAGCGDVADCLVCIDAATSAQTATLAYGATTPALDADVLACQRTLGKETVRFFDAKTKALASCWDARLKGQHANACPSPGDGKATAKIAKAGSKAEQKICKICGGPDRACGGDDDLLPSDIGLPMLCPEVADCGGLVGDLDAGRICAACVSGFDVDCAAPAAVPSVAAYPAACAAASTCPTRLRLDGDDDAVDLDVGWVGFAHDLPGPWLGRLTLAVHGCSGTGTPTCGECTLAGPIPSTGGASTATRRCAHQPWVTCSGDTDCAGGSCRYFLGPPQPVGEGGLTRCALNEIRGPVSGTLDVESGALEMSLPLFTRTGPVEVELELFDPNPAFTSPCPRCIAGVCDAGPRAGLPCVVQGHSALFDDDTSLDCPPDTTQGLAHPLPLALGTGAHTVTLSATSPVCTATGFTNARCHCDTCATAAAEPCRGDADCPGTLPGSCGGLRCLGGSATGAPCGSLGFGDPACDDAPCGVLGEPSKPNACNGGVCTAVGGGTGECTGGPFTGSCSPTETFRNCTATSDCPVAGDGCTFLARPCFPGTGTIGESLSASGAPDAPVAGTFMPALAGFGCVPNEVSGSVFGNRSAPAPARVEIGVTATLE